MPGAPGAMPGGGPSAMPGAAPGAPGGDEAQEGAGPKGPGWVIELHGSHFFNDDRKLGGATYVRNSLLKTLETREVELPIGGGQTAKFTMKELGIGYAILLPDQPGALNFRWEEPNPNYEGTVTSTPGGSGGAGDFGGDGPPGGMGMGPPGADMGAADGAGIPGAGVPGAGIPGVGGPARTSGAKKEDDDGEPPTLPAPKYTFTVQFCWQESLLAERVEAKRLEREAELEKQKLEQQQANQGQPVAANMATRGGNN